MPKYIITFGATVECYGTVEIHAESQEEAWKMAENIAGSDENGHWPVVHPAWDTMDDCRVVDVTDLATQPT